MGWFLIEVRSNHKEHPVNHEKKIFTKFTDYLEKLLNCNL